MSLKLLVVRNTPDAKLPTRGTDRAQCVDFYAAESKTIYPGQTALVDLGVSVVIPPGYGLEFRERSGLATKGIIIGAGVIDEDYHGSLKAVVRFMDDSNNPFIIRAGDKIVQGELVERIPFEIREIEQNQLDFHLNSSDRGDKGFGSTG